MELGCDAGVARKDEHDGANEKPGIHWISSKKQAAVSGTTTLTGQEPTVIRTRSEVASEGASVHGLVLRCVESAVQEIAMRRARAFAGPANKPNKSRAIGADAAR